MNAADNTFIDNDNTFVNTDDNKFAGKVADTFNEDEAFIAKTVQKTFVAFRQR